MAQHSPQLLTSETRMHVLRRPFMLVKPTTYHQLLPLNFKHVFGAKLG